MDYPTISSVSPSIKTILKAIVTFADYMNWQYAQVVTDESMLGHHFVNQLKMEGNKRGLCIGAAHYSNAEESYQNIVDKITQKLDAKVLFINLSPMESMKFLQALNHSDSAATFIVFSVQALSVVPSFAIFARSIRSPVYSADPAMELSASYLNYLRNLRADSTNSNPWFDQWYEEEFACSLNRTNMRQYTEMCSSVASTPISDSPSFEPNFWSASVINSVTLISQALHKTLQLYCGDAYDGVCSQFWNDEMKDTFMENLKDITFTDDLGNEIHIKNGQGKKICRNK